MNYKNKVKLDYIDTSEAAKSFATLLYQNKCYFLDGAWGSGKTEFLRQVKTEASNKKFITLDLWRVKNDKSVIQIGFMKIHPFWYYLAIIVTFLSVVVMVLSTGTIHLGLTSVLSEWGKYLGSNSILNVKRFFSILGILVIIYQFFNIKSDQIYILLLSCKLLKFFRRKKILVIDDFDRIDKEKQKQIYKLFNVLDDEMPIVFVGDFTKFSNEEISYLQKIIYKKVTLPFDLHPQNIWDKYFKNLSNQIKQEVNTDFIELVKKEKRNLRDRERFNDMVNQELFDRDKQGRVQITDELFIIYLYLFYPDKYNDLLNFTWPSVQERIISRYTNDKTEIKNATERKSFIDQKIEELKNGDKDNEFPLPFYKNKPAYLIYEAANNLSELEAKEIVRDTEKLKDHIGSDEIGDFFQYLTSHYTAYIDSHEKMFKIVVECARKRKKSVLMRFVFDKEVFILVNQNSGYAEEDNKATRYPYSRLDKGERISARRKLLENEGLDLSEQIYMLIYLAEFSYRDLSDNFDKLELGKIGDYKFKDIALLLYMSQNKIWGPYSEWTSEIFNCINRLSDEEFVNFARVQGIMECVETDVGNITVMKVNSSVNRIDDKQSELKRVSIKDTVVKLKPRISKLSEKKYSILQ